MITILNRRLILRTIHQHHIRREFHKIRRSFLSIAKSFDRLGPVLSTSTDSGREDGGEAGTRTGRRRPRLTAEQRQALKLQGKYMGTMRGLKATYQAKVKTVRKTRGIKAAIALAQKLSAK